MLTILAGAQRIALRPDRVLGLLTVAAALGDAALPAQEPSRAQPTPSVQRFADPLPSPPRTPFEVQQPWLRPGEVVVVTGSAHGVFEQQQGWLESLLAHQAGERRPVFRNMCWEGDTVYEQWRPMNFGAWAEQFDAVGASTVVLWFGQNEALDDARSVAEFAQAYARLLDEFQRTTPRLIVISPPPFEKPVSPFVPDNTPRNARLKEFTAEAARLAASRGAKFIDIFTPLSGSETSEPRLTENGMHFTPASQKRVAELIARELGGTAEWSDDLEPLRQEVIAKNRLWFDCWRTMNWYFPYGDRTQTSFDKPAAGRPSLAEELEQYKPLIRAADARIHAVASGEAPPAAPEAPVEPEETRRPPEEEQATFQLRDGFECNLFASEADGLVKPTQVCWDERGRLWACCVPSYPQLVPGIKANDFILVCEDSDHDGRVDKSFKFAEGLVMPTGLALGDGGVYVCEATQLIHLRDSDGDGRADERRVVLSGFGTGDSHQCINSICWGPDGRLWFTQGLHNFSLVETPWGLSRCHRTGIWRFNPRSLQLEHFLGAAAASENAWGVGFDDWGQTFYTPGNEPGAFFIDPALVFLPIEQIATGQYREIGRLANTGPKGMRTEFIGTRHLADDLQGVYVKSVYIAGYVELHRFRDDGAGFASELLGQLISSPSPAFRPIETKVGPDGAIYVCDWYNPIIGHYQASYRDPRRDHVHGRVWRLTAKGRPLVQPAPLAELNVEQLLNQLASPERFVREQAKRLLSSRAAEEVIPAADAWLARLADDSPQTPALLYEISGVYAAYEQAPEALLERMLRSPEPRLRAFGTHMVGLWAPRLKNPLPLLERMVKDEAARVRMEAVVAASYVKSPAAMETAVGALDRPRDRFIDYSLTQTTRALKPYWLPALARGELDLDNRLDRLRFILEADGTRDVVGFVRKLAEAPDLTPDARDRLLVLLVNIGSPDDLRRVFELGRERPSVLNELATVARIHKKAPAGDLTEGLRQMLSAPDAPLRAAALRVVGACKVAGLSAEVQQALAPGAEPLVLQAALEATAALNGRDGLPTLASFATAAQSPEVRAKAIEEIAALDVEAAARLEAPLLSAAESEAQAAALMTPLLARRGGGPALARALARESLSADSARLAHRVLSGTGANEPELQETLNQIVGVQGRPAEFSSELVAQLAAGAAAHGDASRGQEVYRSKLANCAACHKTGGEGGDIGPDLSTVGKALTPEQIVESLLWPNRQVKESFSAVRLFTDEGQVLTGYKLNETADELLLRDTSVNVTRRIAKASIEEMISAGSVMPEGLTAFMTQAELQDLIRYLSDLGKAP